MSQDIWSADPEAPTPQPPPTARARSFRQSLSGLRIQFDGRAFGSAMLGYIPTVIVGIILFTIAGIAKGLPWPPRWDDYLFAVFMAGVVVPVGFAGWLLVRDFVVALWKLLKADRAA